MRARCLVLAVGLTLGSVGAGCGAANVTPGEDAAVPVDAASAPDLDASALDAANAESGAACTSNAQCGAGAACLNGACCPSAAQVCGGACCAAAEVCLFDRCVAPGRACRTASDCDSGQYCETGLVSGDGGAPVDAGVRDGGGDGGITCTQPIPLAGRCLSLPAVCAGVDGGAPADLGGCVARCEYHPQAGPLDAVPRWVWGPGARAFSDQIDVWSTPTVGRLADSNCDGRVDVLDPPNVVFVSAKSVDASTGKGTCCQCTNTTPTACHTGVLRMLDGRSGAEVWSLASPGAGSSGFAGTSTALGDIDGDGRVDILAMTGEGRIVMVDASGVVRRTSDKAVPGAAGGSFGWGGGIAVADMDGDGFPEIAYGSTVFTTTNNAITWRFTGAKGTGGAADVQLSLFADVDGDGKPELVAGNTAYEADGTPLWQQKNAPDGFPAVADLDKDGKPEVIVVGSGMVWALDGMTGGVRLPAFALPGTGAGGPPTVADFDGDGKPEIGVAQANYYSVVKPDFAAGAMKLLWKTPNHDRSSSQTGSTVFDFEGDGAAEVIYNDECFLWVFDGRTGAVRFAGNTTSFTATEASLLADVDGDGRAEMLMISNGADPSGWGCIEADGKPTTVNGVTWRAPSSGAIAYRGITVWGDRANGWVGTRTLWSEHTYHVSNICDDRDDACPPPNVYGSIPKVERNNWSLSWLDDFRQNVQDKGIFDAPDATVALTVDCTTPVVMHPTVRNAGLASLPAGVPVALFRRSPGGDVQVGMVATTRALLPGQSEVLTVVVPAGQAAPTDSFVARIVVDPQKPLFRECRDDNDESAVVKPVCVG